MRAEYHAIPNTSAGELAAKAIASGLTPADIDALAARVPGNDPVSDALRAALSGTIELTEESFANPADYIAFLKYRLQWLKLAVKDPRIALSDLTLLDHIDDRWDDKTRTASESVRDIALAMGVSQKTIKARLAKLRDLGYLTHDVRGKGVTSSSTASVYYGPASFSENEVNAIISSYHEALSPKQVVDRNAPTLFPMTNAVVHAWDPRNNVLLHSTDGKRWSASAAASAMTLSSGAPKVFVGMPQAQPFSVMPRPPQRTVHLTGDKLNASNLRQPQFSGQLNAAIHEQPQISGTIERLKSAAAGDYGHKNDDQFIDFRGVFSKNKGPSVDGVSTAYIENARVRANNNNNNSTLSEVDSYHHSDSEIKSSGYARAEPAAATATTTAPSTTQASSVPASPSVSSAPRVTEPTADKSNLAVANPGTSADTDVLRIEGFAVHFIELLARGLGMTAAEAHDHIQSMARMHSPKAVSYAIDTVYVSIKPKNLYGTKLYNYFRKVVETYQPPLPMAAHADGSGGGAASGFGVGFGQGAGQGSSQTAAGGGAQGGAQGGETNRAVGLTGANVRPRNDGYDINRTGQHRKAIRWGDLD